MKTWSKSDETDAVSLGDLEFQDHAEEWHHFHVFATKDRLIFGGFCNVGFMESGFMEREDGETLNQSVSELLADLETYYNDGPSYVSRIVFNERM